VRNIRNVANTPSESVESSPLAPYSPPNPSGDMVTLILPEGQCHPAPKPSDKEACGVEDCPPVWRAGEWSRCSTSCGSGEQRRSVECEQRSALGTTRIFNPPYECMNEERPPTVQLCDLGTV